MVDSDDRLWPKLLQRVCAGSLATIWFEAIADLSCAVPAGYRARPKFPLEGADYTAWLQAAERHGYRTGLAATTLAAVIDRRPDVGPNAFLTVELDAVALTSEAIMRLVRTSGDLSAIVFEVTRFAQNRDRRRVVNTLDAAREQGARVALRATGPGSADPVLLADISPQFCTVGSELIAGVDQRPRRAAMLSAVVNVANQLGATVVADGVTGVEELRVLCDLGVQLAQGSLIGREREQMAGLEPAARELLSGRTGEPDAHLTSDHLTMVPESEPPGCRRPLRSAEHGQGRSRQR